MSLIWTKKKIKLAFHQRTQHRYIKNVLFGAWHLLLIPEERKGRLCLLAIMEDCANGKSNHFPLHLQLSFEEYKFHLKIIFSDMIYTRWGPFQVLFIPKNRFIFANGNYTNYLIKEHIQKKKKKIFECKVTKLCLMVFFLFLFSFSSYLRF